jgi:hypothetical protein
MTSLAEGVIKHLTVSRSIKRQFRKLSKVISTPTAVDLLVLMPPTRPLDTFARALQVDGERSAAKVTALGDIRTRRPGHPLHHRGADHGASQPVSRTPLAPELAPARGR